MKDPVADALSSPSSPEASRHPHLLLVVCAGPESLHPRWAAVPSAQRSYDVAVIDYDPAPMPTGGVPPHAAGTVHYTRAQGPKWMLLREFLRAHRSLWSAYTYVAFPDDDLDVRPAQWRTLVDVADAHELDVFQPAIVPPADTPLADIPKYIRHTHLMPATDFHDLLRMVDFVEIMVPVFRQAALRQCVEGCRDANGQAINEEARKGGGETRRLRGRGRRAHRAHRAVSRRRASGPRSSPPPLPIHGILLDSSLKSGWGLDYVLPQAILPCHRFDLPPAHPWNRCQRTFRYAVVDAVPVVHTRPLGVVGRRALRSSFYKTYSIDPEAEMRSTLAKWGRRSRLCAGHGREEGWMRQQARVKPPNTLRHVPVPVDYTPVQRRLPPDAPPIPTRRTPAARVALPTYLQANLNRERHLVRRARKEGPADRGGPTAPTSPTALDGYYYKLGYGFHARVRRNRLEVVHDLGSFQNRNWNTVQLLHETLRRYTVPDGEWLVCTDDKLRTPDATDTQGVPIWVMARKQWQTYFTYPDHTFYDWHEARTRRWETERRAIMDRAHALTAAHAPARQVAFFRGNVTTSYVRRSLAEAARRGGYRQGLDVRDVRVTTPSSPPSFVSLPDHNRYAFLLHLPGRSYAARLKYLLCTRSRVVYVQKNPQRHEYREFWYDALVHGENCLIVRDRNRYDAHDRPQPQPDGTYRDHAIATEIRAWVQRRSVELPDTAAAAAAVMRTLEPMGYLARLMEAMASIEG